MALWDPDNLSAPRETASDASRPRCVPPVLVVAEDEGERERLVDLLRRAGDPVVAVSGYAEAYAYLKHGAPPCVMVWDFAPNWIDGARLRWVQHLNRRQNDVPLLLITPRPLSRDELRLYGAVTYLQKPVEAAALLRMVAPYCRPFQDD